MTTSDEGDGDSVDQLDIEAIDTGYGPLGSLPRAHNNPNNPS